MILVLIVVVWVSLSYLVFIIQYVRDRIESVSVSVTFNESCFVTTLSNRIQDRVRIRIRIEMISFFSFVFFSHVVPDLVLAPTATGTPTVPFLSFGSLARLLFNDNVITCCRRRRRLAYIISSSPSSTSLLLSRFLLLSISNIPLLCSVLRSSGTRQQVSTIFHDHYSSLSYLHSTIRSSSSSQHDLCFFIAFRL